MADVDDDVLRAKVYTELSKVVTYLSESSTGFSLPRFRRWRTPDAVAGTAGVVLTLVLAVVTFSSGYGRYVLVVGLVMTAAAVVALGKLPKHGPAATTRLRWRLEARSPRTTCTHLPTALAGRVVDPSTGRLTAARH